MLDWSPFVRRRHRSVTVATSIRWSVTEAVDQRVRRVGDLREVQRSRTDLRSETATWCTVSARSFRRPMRSTTAARSPGLARTSAPSPARTCSPRVDRRGPCSRPRRKRRIPVQPARRGRAWRPRSAVRTPEALSADEPLDRRGVGLDDVERCGTSTLGERDPIRHGAPTSLVSTTPVHGVGRIDGRASDQELLIGHRPGVAAPRRWTNPKRSAENVDTPRR